MAVPRPVLPWAFSGTRLLLVMDGVRDPGNLGTLIRGAGAAGCGGVVLVGGCADPWGPKALRAAMGATLRVPIVACPDWDAAAFWLPPAGPDAVRLFAADAHGEVTQDSIFD